MNSNELSENVIGCWEGEVEETKWGSAKVKFIFQKDSNFKVSYFFGENVDPLIIEGIYRIEGSQIFASSWNKGKPINATIKQKKLILSMENREQVILNRCGKQIS